MESQQDLNETDGAADAASNGATAGERSAEDLLAECLALSESDWGRAIRDACERRPELAAHLEHLFQNVQAMDQVLRPTDSAGDADEMSVPSTLGDFELLERVGGGGMGVVYRARQVSLDRIVALKLIRPEHLFLEKSKERFRREAEAISRLHHGGIVPLFEVGEEGGVPYFAMEFIEGQSLATILGAMRFRDPSRLRATDFGSAYRQGSGRGLELSGEGVFSSLESRSWSALCCRIVARVAHALEHAHRNGIVHRDIKPSNIMVTPDGRVVVVDFGLAISEGAASLTRTGSNPGSLPYMSPEQIAGLPVDFRTDIYSLGVTLYELLALRCPFPLSNPELARRHIASGATERLRARNRAVPPEVEAVCLKAMECDRNRRYSSAAEFAEDLANAVTHRPIRAQRFGLTRRCVTLARRHPARTLAACALFLAVCVAPLCFAWQQHAHAATLAVEQQATRDALRRAQDAAEEATAASDFLKEMVEQANPSKAGKSDLTVREALSRSLATIDQRFADAPNVHERLLSFTAALFEQLGNFDESGRLFERARDVVLEHFGSSSIRLVRILIGLSEHRPTAEAEALAREAVEISEQQDQIGYVNASAAYSRLSQILSLAGRRSEAEEAIRKAIVRAHAALGIPFDRHSRMPLRRELVCYEAQLAELLRIRGSTAEAKRIAVSALERTRAELGQGEANVIGLLLILNEIELDLGDLAGAEAYALEAEKLCMSTFGAEHPQTLKARLVLFKSRLYTDGPVPSASEVGAFIAAVRRHYGEDGAQYLCAKMLECQLTEQRGDLEASRGLARQLLDMLPTAGPIRKQLEADAFLQLSTVQFKLGDIEGALEACTRARALAETHRLKVEADRLASVCQTARGDFRAAEETARKARVQLEGGGQTANLIGVQLLYAEGAAIWRQGRFAEGEALFAEYLGELRNMSPRKTLRTGGTYKELGQLYFSWGKLDEAVDAWEASVKEEVRFTHRGAGPSLVFAQRRLLQLQLLRGHAVPDDGLSDMPALATTDTRGDPERDGVYLAALRHRRGGDHARAYLLMKRAQEMNRRRGPSITEGGQYELDFALIAYEEGDYGIAEQMVRDALSIMEAQTVNPAWMRQRARALLARCLLREEEFEQARTLLEEVDAASRLERNQAWALVRKELELARSEARAPSGSSGPERTGAEVK